MRLSSGAMGWIEGLSMIEHGPKHGNASAGESEESLNVSLSFAPLALVEGHRGQPE
jgi:hypothetical protein